MERHCVIFTKNGEFCRKRSTLSWYLVTILTTRVYKYRGKHYQSWIPTDICSQNSVNSHKYDWFSTMLQRVAIVAKYIVVSVNFFIPRFAGRMKTCNSDRWHHSQMWTEDKISWVVPEGRGLGSGSPGKSQVALGFLRNSGSDTPLLRSNRTQWVPFPTTVNLEIFARILFSRMR